MSGKPDLSGHWPGTKFSCQATALIRYVISFAATMSVAMIAVSRCTILTSPQHGRRIFSGKNGLLVVILIWTYSIILLSPVYAGVNSELSIALVLVTQPLFSQVIGDFGYNCIYGKCDFIPNMNSTLNPKLFIFGIGCILPSSMILASYITIGRFVLVNPEVSVLKRLGTR